MDIILNASCVNTLIFTRKVFAGKIDKKSRSKDFITSHRSSMCSISARAELSV